MRNQISGGARSRLDYYSSITEDMLIDIFMFLPLVSIYRFKSVSKVWFSLLSNPTFITAWFQFNNKSLPWIQYHTIIGCFDNPFKFRSSYPDLHSPFISGIEHGFSFEFLINEIPLERARLYLLGSSNGLVLCYSVRIGHQSSGQRRYHVCNPLTKNWVSIPLRPHSQRNQFDVSGIFCESSLPTSCCYKVICIPKFGRPSNIFNVDMFCSDLGEWRSFEVSCDQNVKWYHSKCENVVIRNGVLFWIEGSNRMLVYDINQNNRSDRHQCSLINLPDADLSDTHFGTFCHILGESEGGICYARVTRSQITVSVWVLDVDNWQMLHKDISIYDTIDRICLSISDYGAVRILGFSPLDRNIVLFGCKHRVCGFNIQTRSFEELTHSPPVANNKGKMILPFVLKVMPTILPPSSW